MLLTTRPTTKKYFDNNSQITRIVLNRLEQQDATAIISQMTGDRLLPEGVLAEIIGKTDGIPLYIEELTKTVLESGQLRKTPNAFLLDKPIVIPASLYDSLLARLDRLLPNKYVAQTAACIGREFTYELLGSVTQLPEGELRASLDYLVAAELVFYRENTPESQYIFKHALVRDAAYESLLKTRRPELHGRIAKVLEEQFVETQKTTPELLAYHYTKANLSNKAIHYWRCAGELAVRRAAPSEAIQYFRKGLKLLDFQPESYDRWVSELQVLIQLGPALMVVKGWADSEVGAIYKRSKELASRTKNFADMVPPLVGSWMFYFARTRFDAARKATGELFRVAKTLDDPDVLLQAHHSAWPVPALSGAFSEANKHIELGLSLYDYSKHKHHAYVYMGHDPAVCGHVFGSEINWTLGYPEVAHHHATNGLQLARRLDHTPTLALALFRLAIGDAIRSDASAAIKTTDELFELSEEHKLSQMRAAALVIGGWALAETGQTNEGLAKLRTGLEEWHQIGMRNHLQAFTCLLSEGCVRAHNLKEAFEHSTRALTIGNETGEHWWDSRIHVARGQLLLRSQPRRSDSAAESFRAAIRTASAQKAKMLELRSTTHLTRLLIDEDERQKAYDQLSNIYSWFTEGLDTAELKEAKYLLSELE